MVKLHRVGSEKRLSAGCCALAVSLAILMVTAGQARANVYAAHLTPQATSWDFVMSGPIQITYRLNQAATGVTIEIYRAGDPLTVIRTISGCPGAYGLNAVSWDGTDDSAVQVPGASDYKFRVVAADEVGRTGTWGNVTPKPNGTDEIGDAQFFAPQGVAINRDPASPNFGRIYISSGESALMSTNPGASAVGDGLFLLNNDMSFRGGSAATAAAAGNSLLASDPTANISPWKCSINQTNSDEIVLTDFQDGFEDVYIFNGDGDVVHRVLDRNTTGPTMGTAYNHGNAVSAALMGTGTGRKLWVLDEDKDIGTARSANAPDLIRFNIGNTLDNYTAQGAESKNGGSTTSGPPSVTNFYSGRDIKFGRVNGTSRIYAVSRRANATAGNLVVVCYTLNSSGNVNGDVWNYEAPAMSSVAGLSWNYTAAVAVDEAHNRVAVARDGNGAARARVVILDADTGTYRTRFDSADVANFGTIRSMDFDAAGNLYTTNQLDQHVRMWSPPDGPNSYTTPYYGTLTLNCGSPPPEILQNPSSVLACLGQAVSFTVVAEGHGSPLTYQWKRGTTVVGTSSPTLTVDPIVAGSAGSYTVTVTGCGSATSTPVTLTVAGSCLPDYNADTFVDLGDLLLFAPCALGANIPPTEECRLSNPPKDLDFDGDIDMDDFAVFQRCYAGPMTPDPECIR